MSSEDRSPAAAVGDASSGVASSAKGKARFANCGEWMSYVRDVQMSKITPEARQELIDRAERSKAQWSVAAKAKKCASRSVNATVTCSAALTEQRTMRMEEAESMSRGAPARPAVSHAMVEHSYAGKASRQMDSMDAEDRAIDREEEYSVVARMAKEKKYHRSSAAPSLTSVSSTAPATMSVRPAPPTFVGSRVAPGLPPPPPVLGVSDDDDDGAVALPPPATTDAADEAVLEELRKEPKEDEQVTAKFAIFERFSGKVDVIRESLTEVVESTVATFPEAPRLAVEKQYKELDSRANQGIHDESKFWFVHDMVKQSMRNCRLMEHISETVARKAALLAQEGQTECPICLEAFSAMDPEVDGEPRVLTCCHRVCEPCWKNWTEVTAGSPFCPLCKNADFMDTVNAARPH